MKENTRTALTEAKLDPSAADAFLRCADAGAIDLFVGTTRRWTKGRETCRLVYEAYAPMAVREMDRIAEEAEQRWPLLRTYIVHRTGEVPVGEASVIVGVATAHRGEAFEACRWLIDTLKTRVPIWKREHFADGTSEWVQGTTPEGSEAGRAGSAG